MRLVWVSVIIGLPLALFSLVIFLTAGDRLVLGV